MSLVLKNISKSYNHKFVLTDVNLSFEQCGMYFIKGASGSGKTTLLSIIAGIETYDSGERWIDKGMTISYIFQNFELIDSLTVADNIFLPQYLYNSFNKDTQLIIEQLGLSDLLEHYPYELSHGQKQRVAIARSLIQNAKIILCDEPTESLDKKNKDIVMKLLKLLSKDHIIIVVSHDSMLMEQYYDICYEIKDNKISLLKKHNLNKKIENQDNPLKINKLAFIKIFYKMLYKKHLTFLTILWGLIVLLLIVTQMNFQLFNQTDVIGALNDHVIYVEEKSKGALLNYRNNFSNYRYNIPFQSSKVYVNDTLVDLSLQAIPQNKDNNKDNQGIIINQYAVAKIKKALKINENEIIGSKVSLPFSFASYFHVFEFEITDIIEESSNLNTAQIYYPYNEVEKQLKTDEIEYNQKTYSIYDALTLNLAKYEVSYELNQDMFTEFKRLQDDSRLMCYNPYIEEILFNQQQSDIVQLAFMSVIIILTIMIVIYIIFSNYQLLKKEHYYFAILQTLTVSAFLIYVIYFFSCLCLFAVGLALAKVLSKLLFEILIVIIDVKLKINEILILDYLIVLLVLVYFISLVITIIIFYRKVLANSLKDAKD